MLLREKYKNLYTYIIGCFEERKGWNSGCVKK